MSLLQGHIFVIKVKLFPEVFSDSFLHILPMKSDTRHKKESYKIPQLNSLPLELSVSLSEFLCHLFILLKFPFHNYSFIKY